MKIGLIANPVEYDLNKNLEISQKQVL